MKTSSQSPLIIAGSGRSGTTWILDILASTNNLRPIFEPLHPVGVPSAKPFAYRYVRDEAEEPALRAFMDEVFRGSLRCIWLKTRDRPDRLRLSRTHILSPRAAYHQLLRYRTVWHRYKEYRATKPDRYIVKFVRANLMLGWLANQYDARIVFVVRHPAAVIASKLAGLEKFRKHDWPQGELLAFFRNDQQLQEDFLHRYNYLFDSCTDEVTAYALIWCIENVFPIIKAKRRGRTVIYFENLICNPSEQWPRILSALNLRNEPTQSLVRKPSQQSYDQSSAQVNNWYLLTKWKEQLKEKDLGQIQNILNAFNVSMYNVFDPMPTSD